MKSEIKVTNGKLIRVEYNTEVGRIISIKITGDFFLHPEDSIEELERTLQGVRVNESELKSALNVFFSEERTLLGAKPEDFVTVILNASKTG